MPPRHRASQARFPGDHACSRSRRCQLGPKAVNTRREMIPWPTSPPAHTVNRWPASKNAAARVAGASPWAISETWPNSACWRSWPRTGTTALCLCLRSGTNGRGGGFYVVTSSRDVKAVHLRRDPRASIVVCEHSPPYGGVELRCNAQFLTARVGDAVRGSRLATLASRRGPHTPSERATTSSFASNRVSYVPGTSPTG
jgi:hypothetical protein